ncbi:MAG: plasmid stabilization protein [Deltaproteobacteria bacterium HGW-Deltaproteobacteria-21]|nr:MAG: plasmid stabilization protein [Deltaproteobacteria bacterium HGW-Deltaproteobacteria-21]
MRIRFLEIAAIELDEAIQYYSNEAAGLGEDFLNEVLEALDRVAKFPEAWHPCSKRTRRCQTHRFPYGIIYQIRKEEILVIAIANLHREPDYWEDRP